MHRRMTRLLITGGNGFVGQHLLRYLRGAAPEIEPLAPALNITDRQAIEVLIETTRPDALLHLAAISAPGHAAAAQDHAWAVNLQGTLNLAQAVLAHAPECRFIFVSSAEVYGRAFLGKRKVTEDTKPEPANPYASTKAAAEAALATLPGLQLLRLRPANHTGPGQSPDFVIPAFARQIARIEAGLQPPVLRVGDLETWRDFLDVSDICAAYEKALALPDFAPGEVLNIASGTPRRIGDLLEALLGMARIRIGVETDPAKLRAADIPVTRLDATRARKLLDWSPQIPIKETLATTLAFWRRSLAALPEKGL
jgi:GDP-4-dehydro-6-deoxy-D-mannose reductase